MYKSTPGKVPYEAEFDHALKILGTAMIVGNLAYIRWATYQRLTSILLLVGVS